MCAMNDEMTKWAFEKTSELSKEQRKIIREQEKMIEELKEKNKCLIDTLKRELETDKLLRLLIDKYEKENKELRAEIKQLEGCIDENRQDTRKWHYEYLRCEEELSQKKMEIQRIQSDLSCSRKEVKDLKDRLNRYEKPMELPIPWKKRSVNIVLQQDESVGKLDGMDCLTLHDKDRIKNLAANLTEMVKGWEEDDVQEKT